MEKPDIELLYLAKHSEMRLPHHQWYSLGTALLCDFCCMGRMASILPLFFLQKLMNVLYFFIWSVFLNVHTSVTGMSITNSTWGGVWWHLQDPWTPAAWYQDQKCDTTNSFLRLGSAGRVPKHAFPCSENPFHPETFSGVLSPYIWFPNPESVRQLGHQSFSQVIGDDVIVSYFWWYLWIVEVV